MNYYDLNEYLKADLFGDEEAWAQLPQRARREIRARQHAARGRGARRTDFARGWRRGFFERGRSVPLTRIEAGHNHAFQWSLGDVFQVGDQRQTVAVIDYRRGVLWLRP